eukprot:COSAG02_NODE_193_length_29843_cov_30.519903_38_plen_68_part_00
MDGYKAVAAGYPKLGHWSTVAGPYMQFRGTIHHFELHSKFLSVLLSFIVVGVTVRNLLARNFLLIVH